MRKRCAAVLEVTELFKIMKINILFGRSQKNEANGQYSCCLPFIMKTG